MSFASNLSNAFVIDDSNWKDVVKATSEVEGFGHGYERRDFSANPLGSLQSARKFDLPLIPRVEWKDRIEEMTRKKQRIRDVLDHVKQPIKDQQQTNFCWAFCVVKAIEVARALQGQRYVELSPASIACKIKNFRNVGGWPGEATEFIHQHGVATAERWPVTAIDRRYDTREANAEREMFTTPEWNRLPAVQLLIKWMTLALNHIPDAVGLMWWGHAVLFLDPVVDRRGQFGIEFANSWNTTFGDKGYGVVMENKARPDEAIGLATATAASKDGR